MADCEALAKCPFFAENMEDAPELAELYTRRLCRGDNKHCARYIVRCALGAENVPSDLYPTEILKAKKLLQANGIDTQDESDQPATPIPQSIH